MVMRLGAPTIAQVTKTLRGGVMNGADSAAGWKALAELQYQNRCWPPSSGLCGFLTPFLQGRKRVVRFHVAALPCLQSAHVLCPRPCA